MLLLSVHLKNEADQKFLCLDGVLLIGGLNQRVIRQQVRFSIEEPPNVSISRSFCFFFFAVQFPPESCLQSFCLLLGIEASWTGRVLNAKEVRTVGFVVYFEELQFSVFQPFIVLKLSQTVNVLVSAGVEVLQESGCPGEKREPKELPLCYFQIMLLFPA